MKVSDNYYKLFDKIIFESSDFVNQSRSGFPTS